jgi:transcriptional regulator with XRE-family HTH domain
MGRKSKYIREIGDKIKIARILESMSPEELASKMGITVEELSDCEENILSPSLKTLRQFGKVLNRDVGFFYTDPLGLKYNWRPEQMVGGGSKYVES